MNNEVFNNKKDKKETKLIQVLKRNGLTLLEAKLVCLVVNLNFQYYVKVVNHIPAITGYKVINLTPRILIVEKLLYGKICDKERTIYIKRC